LTIETAIPCGLIINELVTNAMKYAFPEKLGSPNRTGQIEIEMQAGDDNQLTLSVRDNGVGFPKDVNFRRTRSLGLTLVTTLVKQLKGTIELQSEANDTLPSSVRAASEGGTEFLITFSEATQQPRQEK
jgi:two-component sensor histidine kinase